MWDYQVLHLFRISEYELSLFEENYNFTSPSCVSWDSEWFVHLSFWIIFVRVGIFLFLLIDEAAYDLRREGEERGGADHDQGWISEYSSANQSHNWLFERSFWEKNSWKKSNFFIYFLLKAPIFLPKCLKNTHPCSGYCFPPGTQDTGGGIYFVVK